MSFGNGGRGFWGGRLGDCFSEEGFDFESILYDMDFECGVGG